MELCSLLIITIKVQIDRDRETRNEKERNLELSIKKIARKIKNFVIKEGLGNRENRPIEATF